MRDVIEKMPQAAKTVLDRCIKYSTLPQDHPEYSIECDFRLLDSLKDEEEMLGKKSPNTFFAPTTMIKNERETLLSHPLVEAFLLLKWTRFGRHIFNLSLLFYLVYVALFTKFVVSRREEITFSTNASKDKFDDSAYSLAIPIIVTAFTIFQLGIEIFQIFNQRLKYFTCKDNYLQWAAYLATLLFMIPYLAVDDLDNYPKLLPIIVCAVLLLYANLILFLRCFGIFGIYILMFTEILKTMSKVGLMFSTFIFSFGLAFFTLLKEQVKIIKIIIIYYFFYFLFIIYLLLI